MALPDFPKKTSNEEGFKMNINIIYYWPMGINLFQTNLFYINLGLKEGIVITRDSNCPMFVKKD